MSLNQRVKINKITGLYRGIPEFKKGYQPRTNFVKDERADLLADPCNILSRWKIYLSVIECTWGGWC
jgi:hypothetical protein